MARFAVELRNARGLASGKPVEAYLGGMVDYGPDDDGPRYGSRRADLFKDARQIPYFESRQEADRALKTMPDAFFDRYEADIVEIAFLDN